MERHTESQLQKYNDMIAVSQITITKPSILKRFSMLNENKSMNNQIKPFNFKFIGFEINDIIPYLTYIKDNDGLLYRKFIDYRAGNNSMDLPLPSTAYWKSLEDVLTQYVMHNDKKFDYVDHIAWRKYKIAIAYHVYRWRLGFPSFYKA